jgi:site-specific recombinase XerC
VQQRLVRYETRDAAIIELLLQTGLCLSDIELPGKVTCEPGCVGSTRINGRGRRQRIVTVNWKACNALKAYLAIRPKADDDDHVFLTKFQRGLGRRSIELLVTKHLAAAKSRVSLKYMSTRLPLRSIAR